MHGRQIEKRQHNTLLMPNLAPQNETLFLEMDSCLQVSLVLLQNAQIAEGQRHILPDTQLTRQRQGLFRIPPRRRIVPQRA